VKIVKIVKRVKRAKQRGTSDVTHANLSTRSKHSKRPWARYITRGGVSE
jgi:hypothetical protein